MIWILKMKLKLKYNIINTDIIRSWNSKKKKIEKPLVSAQFAEHFLCSSHSIF